jgi:hypothetical protein
MNLCVFQFTIGKDTINLRNITVMVKYCEEFFLSKISVRVRHTFSRQPYVRKVLYVLKSYVSVTS